MDDVTRFAGADEFDDDDFELDLDGADSSEDKSELLGIIGEYMLLEPIGAGGMGQVFRAEHRTMDREVALKILSREIAERRDLIEQFFSEIRAVAKLMHPNIVTAFDAGSFGETHYLVMELVRGEVLSAQVRSKGPLSTSDAVSVLMQAAKALAYAHDLGIVHRDIKPSNMILTDEGVLKILDFGLAQFGSKRAKVKSSKVLMGTPEYMSPEQIENPDQVDGRSDLYSLGASLFFLLTGRAMFTGEHLQVARAQLRQKPPPLFVERNDVDLRLDGVFQKLIAKNPDDRYAHANELVEELQDLQLAGLNDTESAFGKGGYRLSGDAPTSVALDKSTLARRSQIVALDLGLTTSIAAVFDPSLGPQLIPQGDGTTRHIRNMLWSKGEQIKVGAEAVALRQAEPENVFHSMQRWFGLNKISKPFGGKQTPPEVMVAALLRQMMHNSSKVTEGSTSAVVTVPSCYDQMHRRAIRNACRIAGLELTQLLDKPVAAALSWLDVHSRLSVSGRQRGVDSSRLLVVHLGGTGLEASVIQVEGLSAKQIGVCGHWKLGTQRWQHMLAEYFAATLKEKTGKSIREDVSAATRLQRTVEMAMDRLASASKVEIRFDWQSASIQQTVTQDGLVKIAPELTSSLQQSVNTALAIAATDASEIDHVLFAGSMMQMKAVQRIVQQLIPHDVSFSVVDRSDFARGAAIQANHLSSLSIKDDVTPRGFGCTAYDFALLADSPDGKVKTKPRKLLEKALPTPASHARTIRPFQIEGTSRMPALQLIESSSLGGGNWLKLGKVDPGVVFPERSPEDPLQLRMEIDENGILESSLLWPSQNRQIAIPASSDPELTDEDTYAWREWLTSMMDGNS